MLFPLLVILHISGCVCLQDEESPDASPEQTPDTTPSSAHPTPGTTRDTTPESAKGSGTKQKRAEKEAAGLEATNLVRTSFLQYRQNMANMQCMIE